MLFHSSALGVDVLSIFIFIVSPVACSSMADILCFFSCIVRSVFFFYVAMHRSLF